MKMILSIRYARSGFAAIVPIILVLIVIAIVGVGGWTQRNVITFYLNPEEKVDAAFENLFKSTTLHTRLAFETEIPKPSQPLGGPSFDDYGRQQMQMQGPLGLFAAGGKLLVAVEGDFDRTDPKNIKSQATLHFTATGEEGSMTVKGEVKNLGDALYARVTDVPPILPAEAFQYVGPWWSFDVKKIREAQEKQLEVMKKQFDLLPTDQRQQAEQYLTPQQPRSVYSTQTQQFQEIAGKVSELIAKTKFFTGVEKIGAEDIDGVSTYHVKRMVNKQALVDFLVGWVELASDYSNLIMPGASANKPDVSSIRSEAEKAVGKLPEVSVHLWVGTKDSNLYQIQPDLTALLKDKPVKNFTLTLTFSKHNQPIAIDAPADAKEFDLSPFLGGFGLPFSSVPRQTPEVYR
ncbi:MAG: hypothetical protein A2939_01750 [Parcubacteria group bacterium RIFCSPLOWO2_01_FULL_48_18]|nr:MAG: hypothetical protein A2939_01750 [Parcubacteria group bacterium RIFCSPLOWO2_01_FULL_48_18]